MAKTRASTKHEQFDTCREMVIDIVGGNTFKHLVTAGLVNKIIIAIDATDESPIGWLSRVKRKVQIERVAHGRDSLAYLMKCLQRKTLDPLPSSNGVNDPGTKRAEIERTRRAYLALVDKLTPEQRAVEEQVFRALASFVWGITLDEKWRRIPNE